MSDDPDRNKTLDELRDTPTHIVCHHGCSQRSCDACECLALDDECGVLKDALRRFMPDMDQWNDLDARVQKSLDAYRITSERAAELETVFSAVVNLLVDGGPCDESEEESEDPYCDEESCRYCALGRVSHGIYEATT